MNNIDDRVVEMRFDNKQFESGVKTSINSIDKLKKSLNFDSTNKELEKFERASNSMKFDGLKNSFNTSVNDMSVWAIAKFELVRRAVDKVTDSIERCVKSLSVDQVAVGWKKFEEKTGAVATLIAQGYDMSVVDEQLRKLNWYTDETSYNFTDMAKNIAQFTAAGQDLPNSVTALMGIANWAALSGQNAQTASRAMYQISQAMSAGVMRRQDWMSVQNASMNTVEFEQHAIDAAIALGTLEEVADGTYKSLVGVGEAFNINQFANSLTEGAWFTSDVMMAVFNDYSSAIDDIFAYTEETGKGAAVAIDVLGDNISEFGRKAFLAAQEARSWTDVIDATKDAVSTGWMNIFETLLGNYEEQKKIWAGLVDEAYTIFGEPLEKLNIFLKDWKKLGGRTDVIESVTNVFGTLRDVLVTIKEAFREMFPPTTAEKLKSVTSFFAMLSRKVVISTESLEKFKEIVKKLLIPLRILANILKTVVAIAAMGVIAIISIVKNFGYYVSRVEEAIKSNERLSAGFEKLKTLIGAIKQFIVSAKDAVVDFVQNFNGIDSVAALAARIATALKTFGPELVTSGMNLIKGLIKGIITEIPELINKAVYVAKAFVTAFKEYMQIHSPSRLMMALGGFIILGLIKGILLNIPQVRDLAESVCSAFSEKMDAVLKSGFGEKITSIFHNILTAAETYMPRVTSFIERFVSGITFERVSVLALVAAVIWLSKTIMTSIESVAKTIKGAAEVLSGFGSILKGLGTSITNFGTAISNAIKKRANMAAFKSFAISIGIISASIIALALLAKNDAKSALYAAATVLAISIVIGLIAGVLGKVLSKMPALNDGIRSFGIFMLGFSVSLIIMNKVIASLIGVPFEKALDALKTVGLVMLGMIASLALVGLIGRYAKGAIKSTAIMLGISAGVSLFAKAIQTIAAQSLTDEEFRNVIDQLLLFLGTVLVLSGALGVVGRKPLLTAAALLVFALALKKCMEAIVAIGKVKIPVVVLAHLKQNLPILAGVLLGLAVVLRIAGKGAIQAGIGFILMAAAFATFVKVFQLLKGVELEPGEVETIKKSLFTIAKLLLALALISLIPKKGFKAVTSLSIAILALSASLALLTLTDVSVLWECAKALSLVLAVFAAAELLSSTAGGAKSILALSLAVAVISGSLLLLQLVDMQGVSNAAESLALCLVVLAGAIGAASLIVNGKSVGVIISLVVGIGVIAASLVVLGHMYNTGVDIPAIAYSLAAAIGSLSLVLLAASKVQDLEPLFAMIIAIGIIGVVALSIAKIAAFDPTNAIAAAGAIAIVMMSIAIAGRIANGAIEGSIAMIVLAASAVIAAASIKMVATVIESSGWQNAVIAAGIISGVMVLLALAGLIANGGLPGAAAMIALAAAAVIVAASLSLLCAAAASPKEMLTAAGAIVGALAVLAGISALMSLILPAVMAGLVPLAALAAILLVVSIAMAIGAAAFTLFSVGIRLLASAISELTPVLPEFASSLADAMRQVGEAIVDGAVLLGKAGFVAMYSAAYNIIAGFTMGIVDGFKSIFGLGATFADQFNAGFCEVEEIHSPSDRWAWLAKMCGLGFVEGAEDSAPMVRGAGTFLGGEGIQGLAEVVPKFRELGAISGENWGEGLMSVVDQFAGNLGIDVGNLFYSATKEAELQASYDEALRKKNFFSRQDQDKYAYDTRKWTRELDERGQALTEYQERWSIFRNDGGGLLSSLGLDEELNTQIEELTEGLGGGGGGGGAAGAADKLYVSTGLLKKMLENTTKVFRKYFQEISDGASQNGSQSTELEDGFKRSSDAIIRFGAALALASGDMIVSADNIDATLESVEKSLTDYIGTLSSTVNNQISLFKEFNKGDLIDKNSLTKNLQSQIAGVTKFVDDIAALAQRGLSPTLLKQIAEMGPETGFQYAAAIRSMSDAEVKTLNETYKAWDSVKNYAVDDLVSAIALAFSSDENSYDEIGGKIGNEIVDGLLEVLGSQGASSEMKEELNDAISSAVSGFDFSSKVNVRELQNVINNIVRDVVGMYSSINQAAKVSKATDNVLAFAANLAIASKKTEQGVTEIVLSVEELEKALSDYVSSLKSTIDSQMGLFKEFNKGDILNTEEILNSFDSQIEGMSEFMNYVDQLSTRGIDPQLLQSIIDMGPESGYSYAEAIVKMTDDELAALNQKYSQWGGMKDNLADSLTAGLARSFENASSKFQDIGAYAGQQILGSLKRQFVDVGDLGDEVANTLQATLSNPSAYLTEIAEEDITIDVSLVVDDSQAASAIDDLQKTLNDDVKVGASTTSSMATKALWKKPAETSTNITYNNNYNQTINSPKPLSTIEIYRHTNRLVSTKTEK